MRYFFFIDGIPLLSVSTVILPNAIGRLGETVVTIIYETK